jgi:hypothetical protein
VNVDEIRPAEETAGALPQFHAKSPTRVTLAIMMLPFGLPAIMAAQETVQPPSGLRVISSSGAARTNAPQFRVNRLNAVALAVSGQCACSEDGVTFTNFGCGQIFEPGAVIRTGEAAQADLLFKRSGTTVRLQAGTELRLEKIVVTVKDGHPSEHTLLDLRAGRIFTVVRSASADSTLEIRNAAGRSVVEGKGGGKYIIAADGTHVSAIGSVIPIKLIGENGITVIAAGQQFTKQDGKLSALAQTSNDLDLTQLDEFQASINGPAAGGINHP